MSGGWPLSVRIRTWFSTRRRKRVEQRFGALFGEVSAVFFRHDPIVVNFEDNCDEYDPEVGTILPRLSLCASSLDARRVIFEEFCKWFDNEIAGDEMRYAAIANEVWVLWTTRQKA
jgi:hypothetical protein